MALVFQTPWFRVHSKPIPGSDSPHYTIDSPDFVGIVAVDAAGRLLLVRQFRHAVNEVTLELPSGHVEKDETPEQAARKELREETGYEADHFELLATLAPSTARFTNRLWCFFAADARPCPGAELEHGMERVLYDKGLKSLLAEKNFYSAGSCATLFAAVVKGKLAPF